MAISKFNLDEFEFDIEESSFKYCKMCKTKNSIEAKFCLECGNKEFVSSLTKKSTEKYCVKCKTKLENKAKFCYNCGSSDFVSSLDEIDDYFVKEMDAKWQLELDKVNNKIVKANKELLLLKSQKQDYLTKIPKLKKEWEAKIKIQVDSSKTSSQKADLYKDESSGYVKKINKLKEQVKELESSYNEKISIYEQTIKKKENVKKKTKEIDISKYINGKTPLQMLNAAEKLYREQEYEKAFLVYKEAGNNGNAKAQNMVGVAYKLGGYWLGNQVVSVCEKDLKEALNWYLKSAENGFFYGMLNAGTLYLENFSDVTKAIFWFEKSLKAKDSYKSDAYLYLGKCYEQFGYKDENKCVQYYEKSDCYQAYKRLAFIYYEGFFGKKDLNKVILFAEKAYRDGYYDPDGEVGCLLGKLYFGEFSLKKDYKKAYNYFSTAAQKHWSIEAYYYLGLCYQYGYGVDVNRKKAIELIDYAAKKGFAKAKTKLKEFK